MKIDQIIGIGQLHANKIGDKIQSKFVSFFFQNWLNQPKWTQIDRKSTGISAINLVTKSVVTKMNPIITKIIQIDQNHPKYRHTSPWIQQPKSQNWLKSTKKTSQNYKLAARPKNGKPFNQNPHQFQKWPPLTPNIGSNLENWLVIFNIEFPTTKIGQLNKPTAWKW